MNNNAPPVVTFALLAYNQEKYIRQAIEGAFSQDYSPLEIILSDDASTDRTHEIMTEMVAAYSGPHSIIINRNSKNQGISAHLNTITRIITTDFVVIAAGDDISLPNRTSELVAAWINSNKTAKSIHSYAYEMLEDGTATQRLRRGSKDSDLADIAAHASKNLYVLGSTHGWDMSLIRDFEPILPKVISEDVVIPARAAIKGKIHFVDKPLVKYRVDVGVTRLVSRNINNVGLDPTLRYSKWTYYSFLQKNNDYRHSGLAEKYRKELTQGRANAMFPICLRKRRLTTMRLRFFLFRCSRFVIIKELTKYYFPIIGSVKTILNASISRLVKR